MEADHKVPAEKKKLENSQRKRKEIERKLGNGKFSRREFLARGFYAYHNALCASIRQINLK